MARARFIRPEFFTDEKIGELSFGARILFSGIWCQSDLRGVFEYSPKLLRVQVFPFDEDVTSGQVSQWLSDLAQRSMVARFEADGKTWGYVCNWSDYQPISGREQAIGTRRPPPPDECRSQAQPRHDLEHACAASPSPSPSPTPTPTIREGAGGKDSQVEGKTPAEQRTEFCKMLRRLRVADGAEAAERWWTLALDTKAKGFDQRLDAIWWAVGEGKRRGLTVRYASDVEAIAMEWRPPAQPESA